MGKRILFLTKNIRDQRYGLLALAAFLKREGHVLDYTNITDDPAVALLGAEAGVGGLGPRRGVQDVLDKIADFKPDYLAVTGMTGEMRVLLHSLEQIKEVYPELYVVLGGPHATFAGSSIAKHPCIDAVCRGEGEGAFADFLQRHPHGDYLKTPNFVFHIDGQTIVNPMRPLMDINELPLPDYDFIPRSIVDKMVVFASRNCPYSCTYCFNREYRRFYREDTGAKTVYTTMTVDRFMRELRYLKEKYEFKYFYFQDDVFPIARNWITEFAERYPKEIGLPFHVGLNPVMITEDIVAKLSQAGLRSLNMAIESGSPRIRKQIMDRPPATNEEIIEVSLLLRKYGVYINTQNIIMSPTETLEEAKQTLELNIACKVNSAVIGKFQPYPGTRMGKFAEELGLVDSETLLDRLPENYHWESILDFPKDLEIQLDNLLHVFAVTVKYPFIRPLVYTLLDKPWDWLFHRVDDQFWMTHTHRSMESIINRTMGEEFKIGTKYLWHLLFPMNKEQFVY
jgi:radical SAM superfamily enzyme YgiQ (UPF0313 family)